MKEIRTSQGLIENVSGSLPLLEAGLHVCVARHTVGQLKYTVWQLKKKKKEKFIIFNSSSSLQFAKWMKRQLLHQSLSEEIGPPALPRGH